LLLLLLLCESESLSPEIRSTPLDPLGCEGTSKCTPNSAFESEDHILPSRPRRFLRERLKQNAKPQKSRCDNTQSSLSCSGKKNCYDKRYLSVFKETNQSKIAVLSELQNKILLQFSLIRIEYMKLIQFDQNKKYETLS